MKPNLDKKIHKIEDRIWTKIQVPFIVFLTFIIVVFLVSAYLFEKVVFETELAKDVLSVQQLFVLGMEDDSSMMDAVLEAVTQNQEIKKLYLLGDRKALYARAKPLFDHFHREHRITHFYFTRPDRINFLRVHQYDLSGDRIDRPSMLRAVKTGKKTQGTELGPLGTFTLRVVMPWRDQGRIIGYIELGEEVNHIAESVRRVLDVGLMLIIDKSFPQTALIKTKADNPAPRVSLQSGLIVARAIKRIPPALIRYLDSHSGHTNSIVSIADSGRKLFVATLPLSKFTGEMFGRFVVVRDVTSLQKRFWNTMILITGACLLAGALVIYLFTIIQRHIERDYRHKGEMELQLSRLDQEHQRIVQVEKLSAMGLMVGEIAHQLNNPLVGVVNMAQLAERCVEDVKRTRGLLSEIRIAGKDCHGFVKRMLEFSKISNFDLKPTDLKALVEETVSFFRQSSGVGQQIYVNIAYEAVTLMIDPILVRHALFNLLSNAKQASKPEGLIEVTLEQSEQGPEQKPGWMLRVMDRGEGLSDAVKKQLFTPFFTTRAEGTGLGLAVVQHVTNVHHGFIRASNRREGGAIFAFWLPAEQLNKTAKQVMI